MYKYNIGQPVIYISSNIDPKLSFGVITKIKNDRNEYPDWLAKYPYYVIFCDEGDDYFSENAVDQMVIDYERYQNGEYEED